MGRPAKREKFFKLIGLVPINYWYESFKKIYSSKSYRQPFWRAGGTQTKKSAKLCCLCWLAVISKTAGLMISNYWFFWTSHAHNWCQSPWTFFPSWNPSRQQPWSTSNFLLLIYLNWKNDLINFFMNQKKNFWFQNSL